MSKEQLELVKQGLIAGDPNEIMELLSEYIQDASENIISAYGTGITLLSGKDLEERNFENVKKRFEDASENLLDAAYIFNLDCLIDLLNCED